MLVANTDHIRSGHRISQSGHAACGALGGLITFTVLVALFGNLVAVTGLMGVLSSTTLVMLTLFWWALWWLAIEYVADRALERLDSGREHGPGVHE
jgi:hypothetical protein